MKEVKIRLRQAKELPAIELDENIAYFIGVLHSDGCIYVFNDKKRNRQSIRLNLTVGKKSIPMSLKFKKILFDYFKRTVNLRKIPNKPAYAIQTSINSAWGVFKKWDKGKIPKEIEADSRLFGAYLAGVIDGDGHIKIKHNKDRKIPQCLIRIASDHPLHEMACLLEKFMFCKVHFECEKNSQGVSTCFYLSKKNLSVVKTLVYPHIVLTHKKSSLEKFFKMKENEPIRI